MTIHVCHPSLYQAATKVSDSRPFNLSLVTTVLSSSLSPNRRSKPLLPNSKSLLHCHFFPYSFLLSLQRWGVPCFLPLIESCLTLRIVLTKGSSLFSSMLRTKGQPAHAMPALHRPEIGAAGSPVHAVSNSFLASQKGTFSSVKVPPPPFLLMR